MGLSVVHGIVHAVGGHIFVQSAAGQGTSMGILLPASADASGTVDAAAPAPDAAGNVLSGLRIMVVDDEHAMSSMLEELLTLQGAQVSVYNQPHAALAAFERNPDSIDLVITDETMPELSGLDMARAMLALRPNKPIILCTGYSTRVNADIAGQVGIAGFMHKPLDIQALLQLIQERVRNWRRDDAALKNNNTGGRA
jgi:DNA-binding NtrC family response regulator